MNKMSDKDYQAEIDKLRHDVVEPTHLLLNYLTIYFTTSGREEIESKKLMNDLSKINENLWERGIKTNVFFRGPYFGEYRSELIDDRLGPFTNTGIIERRKHSRVYAYTEEGKKLLDNDYLDKQFNWDLDDDTLKCLKEEIKKVIGEG